jgi:hypothetical protein
MCPCPCVFPPPPVAGGGLGGALELGLALETRPEPLVEVILSGRKISKKQDRSGSLQFPEERSADPLGKWPGELGSRNSRSGRPQLDL